MNQNYIDTVRLLLTIARAVFASGRFAMKGGTALNLFVQEMPRLSVDIDLVFVDHRPDRQTALQAIAEELVAVQTALARKGYRAHLPANAEGDDVKLSVSSDAAQVKVEVNFVFRGTALPVETRSLVAPAQDLFTTDLTVPVLATAELYGSKLVAAMDRQHPRDIFDVMHMLDHFGWQPSFIDCFVVYLAGHNRPVHEVLFTKTKPLEPAFTNEFAGMTRDIIELDTLGTGAGASYQETAAAVDPSAPRLPAVAGAGRSRLGTDADAPPARVAGDQVEADEPGQAEEEQCQAIRHAAPAVG